VPSAIGDPGARCARADTTTAKSITDADNRRIIFDALSLVLQGAAGFYGVLLEPSLLSTRPRSGKRVARQLLVAIGGEVRERGGNVRVLHHVAGLKPLVAIQVGMEGHRSV